MPNQTPIQRGAKDIQEAFQEILNDSATNVDLLRGAVSGLFVAFGAAISQAEIEQNYEEVHKLSQQKQALLKYHQRLIKLRDDMIALATKYDPSELLVILDVKPEEADHVVESMSATTATVSPSTQLNGVVPQIGTGEAVNNNMVATSNQLPASYQKLTYPDMNGKSNRNGNFKNNTPPTERKVRDPFSRKLRTISEFKSLYPHLQVPQPNNMKAAREAKSRLAEGEFTSAEGYRPYFLTAFYYQGGEGRMADVQKDMAESMKDLGVLKPKDEELGVGANALPRYVSMTNTLRAKLLAEKLIVQVSFGRYRLTHEGSEAAQTAITEMKRAKAERDVVNTADGDYSEDVPPVPNDGASKELAAV